MILRSRARNFVAGLTTVSVAWLASPRAEACSCIDGYSVDWPASDQVGVPLDTSVVVSGSGALGDTQFLLLAADAGVSRPVRPELDAGAALADIAPEPLPPIDEPTTSASPESSATSEPASSELPSRPMGLHLVSPSGAVAALEQTRQLLTNGCVSHYRIYEQTDGQLLPGTRYQVYDGSELLTAFTTGDAARDVEAEKAAARAVKIETLGSIDDPTQVVNAYVTNVTSPLFVHYDGSVDPATYRMQDSKAVGNFALGLLACPTIELLGMDGQALDVRELCTPTKCKALGNTWQATSCGGNPSFGVSYEEFQTLGDGCDSDGAVTPSEPTAVPSGTSTSAGVPSSEGGSGSAAATDVEDEGEDEPNKVPLDSATSQAATGCSTRGVGSGGSGSGGSGWAWLLAMTVSGGFARRARRRV